MNRLAALLLPFVALPIAVAAASGAQAAEPVTGKWMTEDKDAIITIAPCGASLCGKLTKFLVTPPEGAGQRDVNNPNAKLRSRRILGLTVLSGFKDDGDDWRGRIYDPKSGKSYRSIMERTSDGGLSVKGCVGPFCKTQNWTRVR